MASPFTTADPSDPGSGSVPPGESSARYVDPREMAANALWTLGNRAVGSIYNDLIKPVGQVFTGELAPSMEPGPNQLSVPEYALNLAGTGIGAGSLVRGATEAAAFDPTAMSHFGVYHGTGARQPFHHFDDDFMGTGEGTQYEGWGHYVAERQGIASSYRSEVANSALVPVDEAGIPLSELDTAEKYFQPGSIVPGYGDKYDRVISFAKNPDNNHWSTLVQPVALDRAKEAAKVAETGEFFDKNMRLKDPDIWSDIDSPARVHATMPPDHEIERMGYQRGWDMGHTGGILNINVIPEKNEFLDLNTPWMHQDSIVQERLTKAGLSPDRLDPAYYSIRDDTNIPSYIGAEHAHMTGRDLYNSWVNQYAHEAYESAHPDLKDAMWPEDFKDQVKETVSKQMDAAGVPGFKFLDRVSRQTGPALEHTDNFRGMPGGIFTEDLVRNMPLSPKNFSVADVVAMKKRDLQTQSKLLGETVPEPGYVRGTDSFQAASDWLDREHAAGRLSLGDNNRTRNFVVVNPNNLEIRTWNGRPLTPVDHDPFAAAPGGPQQ